MAIATGAISLVRSFGDPFAARGPTLGSSDPSLSLGSYNLIGSPVLVAVGVLLVVGVRSTKPWTLQAAAGLGVLAGLSLHAQLGFTDPVLGGNPTSAAVFFSLALVAFLDCSSPGTAEPSTSTESDHP